jgi:hypothetical protein
LALLIGVALVLLGATGATVTQRHLDHTGRSRQALLALVPFGVLVGAGASLVRGWDLTASLVVGAVLLPVVGALGRLLEVRRARRATTGADPVRRGAADPLLLHLAVGVRFLPQAEGAAGRIVRSVLLNDRRSRT